MTRGATAPLTALPAPGRWDYGGFTYGLEPLVLPAVGEPDALRSRYPTAAANAHGYAGACRLIRTLGEGGAAPALDDGGAAPALGDEAEELYWFRWITGHQVCFVIWRLMGQLLDDVDRGRIPPEVAVGPMRRYVDGYSAMLLYTGSCPRETYHALIRPSMRLRHRAFSGSWAPDYPKAREFFRGRRPPPLSAAGSGELSDSVRLHNLVHDGVAAKLVPEGGSLLTRATVRRLNPALVGMIYDSYFVTVRSPVTRHEVITQLLRRLVAIARDVAGNGLHAHEGRGALPAELLLADVVRCEDGLAAILLGVARSACGAGAPGPAHNGLRATAEATGA